MKQQLGDPPAPLWAWIGQGVTYEVWSAHPVDEGRVWLVPIRERTPKGYRAGEVAKYDTEGRCWAEWPEIRHKAADCLLEKLRDLQDGRELEGAA